MRRLTITALALAAVACDKPPEQHGASVTVKLPPARPYTPKPGFSIGTTTGQNMTTPVQVDG